MRTKEEAKDNGICLRFVIFGLGRMRVDLIETLDLKDLTGQTLRYTVVTMYGAVI